MVEDDRLNDVINRQVHKQKLKQRENPKHE